MKMLSLMYHWTRKSHQTFEVLWNAESKSGLQIQTGFAFAEVCTVLIAVVIIN